MILGLNLLMVMVISSAALILFLEQRQAAMDLHENTSRQVAAAARQALASVEMALNVVEPTEAALQRLADHLPALSGIGVVDEYGKEVLYLPANESETTRPVLLVASADARVVADVDAAILWREAVNLDLAGDGDAYLVNTEGQVLAVGGKVEQKRDPKTLPSFQSAREDGSGIRFYKGLSGGWVIGEARSVPGLGVVVMTETPLSAYRSMLIRGIALAVLALVLTALMGEWVIRRIVRSVLLPLETLHKGAQAVGAGDYRYRIRVAANTDRELADLGRAFNDMIVKLQDSQQQIDAYRNEMESIVDLRARELSRKALQLEVAAEVSRKIATLLDPRALIREVVALLQERFKIYHVEILLVDEEKGVIRGSTQKVPAARLQDETLLASVVKQRETRCVPDVAVEARFLPNPALPATQSMLMVPLQFGERVIGVLDLESEHRDAFRKDEIAVLESLANEIAVSLHNAQMFDALETANRDLAQATLQAKQASLVKSRFLLNASHKLRTPLNAIIGYSETILSGIYGVVPEKMQDRQKRILDNGRVLQALIEDMLDLSSIEVGSMEMNLDWVELPPLLQEVMFASQALHQTGYAAHDLQLRLDMDGPVPPVWADLDRLRYILINLMSNGVKFTPQGEVVMAVEVQPDAVLIRVSDTGPGISDEELKHLFEPFQHQRGSIEAEGKGTGLGLPVSKLLAQMHGGDLSVESTLHEGSRFTLRLPRRADDQKGAQV